MIVPGDGDEMVGAKRDPILAAWLLISVALYVTGLASLVDGAVVWVKFFQQFIDQYRTLVRNPLQAAVSFIWPSSWPAVPGWASDVLVVWASVFIGTGTLSLIVRPQNYRKNILYRAVRSVAYAIAAVFAAFILLLFVNFQLKRLHP